MYDVEESQEDRTRRLDQEHAALRAKAPDSVRSRIERILAAGSFYEPDGAEGHTVDRALLKFAGIMTKAVAIALVSADHANANDFGIDVEFDERDAARALCGLSALLTEGYHLSYDISSADELAERAQ